MTLNQTWKNCLQMWKWIDEVWDLEMDVEKLKWQWLKEHGNPKVHFGCFFCEYQEKNDPIGDIRGSLWDKSSGCQHCPGVIVDPHFHCENEQCHYLEDPKGFYQILLELDAIRKGDKDMAEFRWSDGDVTDMSAETEAELRKKFRSEPELKFGDIVSYKHDNWGKKRIVLYDSRGELQVYSISYTGKGPYRQDLIKDYAPTGKNIFEDDLLSLRN